MKSAGNRLAPSTQVLTPKMAKNTKRIRSADTTSGAIAAMVEASLGLPELPAHINLRDGDRPFWDNILRARARSEWSEADLVVAAQLARCMADIEREQRLLDAEGTVVANDRGTLVTNPCFRAINELKQSQLATFRVLTLNANAKADSRVVANRRRTFNDAVAAKEQVKDEDGLLA